MRSLVTGAAGFVGHYLIDELVRGGDADVHATRLPHESLAPCAATIHELDVTDSEAVTALLGRLCPDRVFHLAAMSSVALSWKMPAQVVKVNAGGALNVLEAVRQESPQSRVVLIGSSEEYGFTGASRPCLTEEDLPRPGNIYAVSKVTQNLMGSVYARAYDLEVVSVRAFNHMGPGQAPQFVVADFCRQIAEIEAGRRESVLRVGDLSSQRDFCDVRDIVRAYVQLSEVGEAGQTYNVGSGVAVSIQEILDTLVQLSTVPLRVEVDPAKYRPSDIPVTQADITKLQALTGWVPTYDLATTLAQTLDWWRRHLDDAE
ncbi:MAG: GDP-mannose 4,6-dehydratase [Propionibacteriaceae bacterium]|jgi:GDP-4-dehydro-6-deoxy-D-mannose reductase|nr:GDP-mannose 4,6-dehydratase [Propionibacteriaceae bacterium]